MRVRGTRDKVRRQRTSRRVVTQDPAEPARRCLSAWCRELGRATATLPAGAKRSLDGGSRFEKTHKNQSNSFPSCGAISPVARGSSKHTLSSATFSSSMSSVTLLVSARKASGEAPRAMSCSAAGEVTTRSRLQDVSTPSKIALSTGSGRERVRARALERTDREI